MPSGDPWTIGIAHTEDDLARSVDAFATAITASAAHAASRGP
jgi:hypothetical protein